MLEHVEKNLEEYKKVLDLKEKQLSDAKKILVSAKNSCWKQRTKSLHTEHKTAFSRVTAAATSSLFRKPKKLLRKKRTKKVLKICFQRRTF